MKSASSLEQAFVELTNALPGVERRKTFGRPAILHQWQQSYGTA